MSITRASAPQPHRSQPQGHTRIVLDASLEARSAIVYAALIILLAVSPIFFMGEPSGAFFKPLAISYGLAIIASMVVTLTVIPALCLMFVRNEIRQS